MRPKVLVIGSTNTDMVVHVPSLPQPGETVLGGTFQMTPGGKGANQAVSAARAGGEVAFLTAVGDDAFGTAALQRLAAEKIATRCVVIKRGTASGVALIMVDAVGENLIAVAPGANAALQPADIDAARGDFTGARMVLMQLEIPPDTVLRAAELAAEADCTLLLNPAPMPADGLPEALLARVDILTPNERELAALAPDAPSTEAAAAAVLARGPRVLVVTQGKRGAAVFTRDGAFQTPAIRVNSIDTVGAGDCFSACLGVALAEGRSLADAVRFAVAAAGLSTTVRGAQEGLPVREAIEAAMSGA